AQRQSIRRLPPSCHLNSPSPCTKAAARPCPKGSFEPPMSTPTRRICSFCCARAASGQAMADPAIPLMRSRRRIAFSKALDCADYRSQRILQQGFATNEIDFRVSLYGSNPERSCPLGVISGHSPTFDRCPLYPQKRTSQLSREMSALCQKRTHAPQAIFVVIRSLSRP